MFEIVRSLFESDTTTDFVAIGNLINLEFESTHSAFVIHYQNNLIEYHYTGETIDYNKLQRDYYHKIAETILPEEVPAFIAHCKTIQKHAKPIYGYFYSGEYYDNAGVHFGEQDLGERMTCVGFCLNVLKGFLEADYLVFTDWTEDSHNDTDYLESYCTKNNIEPSLIKASHRRITPRECLTSCFFRDLPIKKTQIDHKLIEVNNHFELLYKTTNN